MFIVCKDSARYAAFCPQWSAHCTNSAFVQGCCRKTCHLCWTINIGKILILIFIDNSRIYILFIKLHRKIPKRLSYFLLEEQQPPFHLVKKNWKNINRTTIESIGIGHDDHKTFSVDFICWCVSCYKFFHLFLQRISICKFFLLTSVMAYVSGANIFVLFIMPRLALSYQTRHPINATLHDLGNIYLVFKLNMIS